MATKAFWRALPLALGVFYLLGMGAFVLASRISLPVSALQAPDPGPYIVCAIFGLTVLLSFNLQERRIQQLERQLQQRQNAPALKLGKVAPKTRPGPVGSVVRPRRRRWRMLIPGVPDSELERIHWNHGDGEVRSACATCLPASPLSGNAPPKSRSYRSC